jgi:hypothetical protein
MNLSENVMHTKFPLVPALILVLAPSTACLLLGFIYHFLLKRKSLKERKNLLQRISPVTHRRDDFRSVLLILGIAALASAVSAR